MGYRERKALRGQQEQQAFGKGLQNEQRVRIMAPRSMNWRDDARKLGEDQAFIIDNALPDQDGLRIERAKRVVALIASSPVVGGNSHREMIAYDGTASATDMLWCKVGNVINDVGTVLATSATATCTFVSAPSALGSRVGRYIQVNQTLIYVAAASPGMKFTGGTADSWETWTMTVSASPDSFSMNDVNGIYQFKSRIYTWAAGQNGFAYSSVDQVAGTSHFFNLAYVMGDEGMATMHSLTRDGGAGPDDFAMFIGKKGTVVVYQGSNPGDAGDWSLVGKYQIGVPFADECAVTYGSQVYVLCQDDVYILPDELTGKRQATLAAYPRVMRPNWNNTQVRNGVYWPKKNVIIFSDSTTLSVQQGFAFTQSKVGVAAKSITGIDYTDPDYDQTPNRRWPAYDKQQTHGKLVVYKDRLYTAASHNASGPDPVYEIMPDAVYSDFVTPFYARIITRAIDLPARTNITMVNPVFATRAPFTSAGTAHTSTNSNIRYKTAVIYDNEHKQANEATASASLWLTASTSGDSKGLWQPAFGTGDVAQIQIDVISASTSAELILKYIDITIGNTGGI